MKREIKFRGKTESNKFIYGDLIQYENGDAAIFEKKLTEYGCEATEICRRTKVVIETIGQYTGLKDKNGKEIYEGDILSISQYFNNGLITFGRNENLDSFSLEELKGSLISKNREVVTYEEAAMVVGDMYLGALFGDMRKSMPIFEFEIIGNIYDNKDLLED